MREREHGAEFGAVRRAWADHSDDEAGIVCHLAVRGPISIAALIEHLALLAPGVPLSELRVAFPTVRWLDRPTEEERQGRIEARAAHDRRHAQWERETYDRLRAKFEAQ